MSKWDLAITMALVVIALCSQAMVIVERGSYRSYDVVIIAGIAAIGVLRIRRYSRTRASQK